MGGNHIPVENGVINIETVTGDIVITAIAEVPKGNLADPTSEDWQEGYRLSLSAGTTSKLAGHTTTNYIPCNIGDVLRVKGLRITGYDGNGTESANAAKIGTFTLDKTKIGGLYGAPTTGTSTDAYGAKVSINGDISEYTLMIKNDGTQTTITNTAYIRIDGFLMDGYTKEDVIITINEEIENEDITKYSVVNYLTNCTNSNSATTVKEGSAYSATITANTGYTIKSAYATMGGSVVSVNDGVINIASVTGDIVITAEAVADSGSSSNYTNLLPSAIDTDGSAYGDGKGYMSGYKLSCSSTGGTPSATSGAYVSGFMPVEDNHDTIRIKNIALHSGASINNIILYNKDKTKLYPIGGVEGGFAKLIEVDAGDIYRFSPKIWLTNAQAANIGFFRFSCGGITDETIVTVNEEIV